MCMYIYIYIHIYTHMCCVYTYIHIYVYIYIYIHIKKPTKATKETQAGYSGWSNSFGRFSVLTPSQEAHWSAVPFIPKPMPKPVCRTNLYNKIVLLEVCRTCSGRGIGINGTAQLKPFSRKLVAISGADDSVPPQVIILNTCQQTWSTVSTCYIRRHTHRHTHNTELIHCNLHTCTMY